MIPSPSGAPLRPCGFFLLRTPLLPFDELEPLELDVEDAEAELARAGPELAEAEPYLADAEPELDGRLVLPGRLDQLAELVVGHGARR